jgi:molybdopterin converting factor small subunit
MKIGLQLHWGLDRYFPDSHAEGIKLILPDRISIDEFLKKHNIPAGDVGMVAVNGCLAGRDRILNDQDNVHLYPPLEGG